MKKVLSVFLSIVMLLNTITAVDLSAYASTNHETGELCSGVSYDIDLATKTCFINGSGEIKDFSDWRHNLFFCRDDIKTLRISKGITKIGNWAFACLWETTKIVLSDTVVSIGDYAFYDSQIASIDIPESVTSIGEEAFSAPDWIDDIELQIRINNPKCELSNDFVSNNSTIYGYEQSTAQLYAKNNSIKFIPIEELKICSNDNNLSVNIGKTIMIGAQVYKDGKVSEDLSKIAITIENPNIASSEYMRIKENTCYISILGKAEGLTYINVSDSKSGFVKRIPLQVTQVHGNVYDFNSVPVVKIDNHECNFYNYNGMYIDSFPKAWTSGELKFNVYNTRMTYGIVEIHDKNGKLVDAVIIDKYSENNTGIWETVVDNSMCIYNDIKDRTLLTYKQSTGYSKKTTVSIKNMPKGGYLKITNDVNESNILAVINLSDTLMALKGAYDKGIKYSSATSKKFAENITKELITNAAKYEFIQTVGANGEKFATKLFKKVGKKLVFNKSAYSDFTSSIVEALSSLDLWDTIQSVAVKSGISIGENVFMTFSGLPGLVLKGLFTVSSAVNAICQVNHLFRTIESGYIQLNEKISNTIISNGVSVKYCDGSDFKEVLESYNIEIDESYVNYFKENFKTFNHELIDFIESYEIKMLKNKQVSQPNSPVEVTITVSPQLMQYLPYLNVYHKKDDGTFEKVEITKSTLTTISFITNHFSEYCIVPLIDKSKMSIENAKISAIPTQKYTGKQVKPNPKVILNGKELTNGTNYDCVYEYNISQGLAKLTIVGKNNYYGAVSILYSIKCTHDKTTTKISKATTHKNGIINKTCNICKTTVSTSTIYCPKTITLSATSYTYNGKVKKPSVTIKDSKGKKVSSNNYTISYAKGRKNVGKYTVTIKFKGNYSGTVKKTFTINPRSTSISKLTAGKKKFTVKWKKLTTQTTGYQIQYSTDKNFKKNNKTVTVSKNSTTSKTISKLSAKKKYYVRIRTYKTVKVNGKSTKIYSSWSKAKTVTTKK